MTPPIVVRRLSLLLPLVFVGCKAGRQVAMTDAGLVASTAESGTFVAGKGRVAPPAESLAFSPDGRRLAIATKEGVRLWPSGGRIDDMAPPLAWGPGGEDLAGIVRRHIVVQNLATGKRTFVPFNGTPTGLRWTSDARILAFDGHQIGIEGAESWSLRADRLIDACPIPNGDVAFLVWEDSTLFSDILRYGTWRPQAGEWSTGPVILSFATEEDRFELPIRFAFGAGGDSFAVAAIQIRGHAENLNRIRRLAQKVHPSRAESRELDRWIRGSKKAYDVFLLGPSGQRSVLWSTRHLADMPTDLAFSPDGRWLAIGLADRTVRVHLAAVPPPLITPSSRGGVIRAGNS